MSAELPPDGERWNHNIEYERLVMRHVPDGATNALDVGCGEGHQARMLAVAVPKVIGVDSHAPSIELARAQHPDGVYLEADFLTHDFGSERFDVIAASASLHHVDTRLALQKMRQLLKPNGRLVVIGLARRDTRWELLRWELTAVIAHNVLHRQDKRREWQHESPVIWPPPESLRQIRAAADDVIPGARIRWLPLWRYELVWDAT